MDEKTIQDTIDKHGHVDVTMGDLIDLSIKHWVVLSYQEELDEPEVIGPFDSQKEAQVWSSENFMIDQEIRHKVVWMVEPSKSTTEQLKRHFGDKE